MLNPKWVVKKLIETMQSVSVREAGLVYDWTLYDYVEVLFMIKFRNIIRLLG